LKDLLWWLLKENIAVNALYKYVAPYIFRINNIINNTEHPILNKSDIKDIYTKGKGGFNIKGYTSGTTNQPLTVYRSIKSILLEEYIVKSYLHKNNVSLSPRIAVLRGDHLFGAEHKGSIFWKIKPFTKRLFLSSYHISENTAEVYFKELERYKPEVIMAYPSSISLLAKMAKQNGWKPNWNLVCVFTSSELFSKNNQDLVKSVFGKVLDHYGQAERVAALQLCNNGHYHVREDYSFVEFVADEYGRRIVGTNIHNSAMPLNRYDTNDYVQGVNFTTKCSCGNPSFFVEKILGRDDDFIILPNGNIVGRLDVVFKGVEGIVECQLEQTHIDSIIVRFVPKNGSPSEIIEKDLTHRLRERLGQSIKLDFVVLSHVPRTKAGKFRSVIRSKDIVSA